MTTDLIKERFGSLSSFPDRTTNNRSFIRNIFHLLKDYGTVIAGVGAARLLTFLASAILARKLGVEGFGAFSLAYNISMLVGQLPGVLDTSFVRYYALSTIQGEKHALIKAHLYIKIGVLGLLVVVSIISLGFVTPHLFEKAEFVKLIFIAMLAGGLFSLFSTGLAYYQGARQFLPYTALNFTENLIALLAIVLYSAFSAPTALGSMGVYAVVYTVFGVGVGLYLHVKSGRVPVVLFNSQLKTLLGFSGWLIPAGLCYVFLQRIDLLLVARFTDYFNLGLYGAAVRLVGIFSLFTGNISVIFLPKASQAVKSPQFLKKYFAQSSLVTLGILLLIAAGILWAPQLLQITMGPEYTAAAGILRILLVGYAFVAISSPMVCLIYGFGKTQVIFVQRVLELGTALIAFFILMPRLGAPGAAFSLVVAYGFGGSFAVINSSNLVSRLYRKGVQKNASSETL